MRLGFLKVIEKIPKIFASITKFTILIVISFEKKIGAGIIVLLISLFCDKMEYFVW